MTLIEVMVVVAIIGILVVLAVVGYRKWLSFARAGETKDLMLGLVTGLAMYNQDTGGYLNCSAHWADYYPSKPNGKKRTFHRYPPDKCWNLIAADTTAPTYMGFVLRAGTAKEGVSPPAVISGKWDAPTAPWFVLMAVGDNDADGQLSHFVSSSFEPGHVLTVNDDE